jgi:hypothetical protein
VISLNLVLAGLRLGLKKSPIGQKLEFTVSTNGLELKKINTLGTGSYISILLIGT